MELIVPSKRKLLLSNTIDASNISEIINKINEINDDDETNSKYYKNYPIEPIKLYINSFGGECYSGLALVDIIKQSKTPVHTICIGSAMSMGFIIYLAGHERYIGEHATLMFHDLTAVICDMTQGMKIELDEALRIQKILCNEITSSSMVTQEFLDDYITRKANWYISPEEAIKLKLANNYYKE